MVVEASENPEAEEQAPSVAGDTESEDAQGSEQASVPDVSSAETAEAQELAALRAQLAEAEQKTAEYLDGWQRTQAAFANFRKRSEAEQANWRVMANAALLARILPVLDDFRRAFEVLPAELEGHAWMNGIVLIRRKLQGILDAESVKQIEVKPGDPFDPLVHQAVLYQVVEGFGEGQIVTEIENGYLLGERVLRPSMVVVAKAPVGVEAAATPAADQGSGSADAEAEDPTNVAR